MEMYHIKENRIIIFNGYLQLKYSIKLIESYMLSFNPSNKQHGLIKSIDLYFEGFYFYNDEKLKNPVKKRLYQDISYDESENLQAIKNRIKETSISVRKLELELKKIREDSSYSKDNLIKFLNSVNTYIENNPDKSLRLKLLHSDSIKDKLNKIFQQLEEKGVLYNE